MNPSTRTILVLSACATLLITAFSPADAAPAQPVQDHGVVQDHAMGSQIRKHEGGARLRVKPKADPAVLATVAGIDVSGYQGNVNWAADWDQGKRFAYVKATESTGYVNPYFAQQYDGSYDIGMLRGAYHFAVPDRSSGATQANYFLANGGGWSSDGRTLPGALDMEYNPYGSTCYGLSTSSMVSWVKSFSDQYHARTHKWPVIYTSTSWWSQCTGNKGDFSSTNPLWVARYASAPGTLPYAWQVYTFWQYSSSPIDQDVFNGSMDRLVVLARTPD